MARLYAILAVVGWAWTLIVLIYAAWRWARSPSRRPTPRGFPIDLPPDPVAADLNRKENKALS